MHHVRGKAGGGVGSGGEAHAVDGDTVPQVDVLQDHLGLNLQYGAVGAFADCLKGAHFFYDASEHLPFHLAFPKDVFAQPGEDGRFEF